MAVAWFSVTTTIRAGNGQNVVFAFRAPDGVNTIDDFADELSEHGVITGERFRVTNARAGRKGVLDERRDIMLTREGIAAVQPFSNPEDFEIYE